jgi:hypothetical protein
MPTPTKRRAAARTKPVKSKTVADEVDDIDEDAPEAVVEETPKKKTRVRKTSKKVEPEPEPEDDEDLEDDDDEDEAPAPSKSKSKKEPAKKAPAKAEPKYGTKWLAEHLSEKLGREIASYDLRAVLRRMARKGELDREIGSTRERYEFEGAKDPVVKRVLETIKSGAIDKDKKEKLAELKAKKAAGKKGKKAAEEPEEELEDDVEDLDDEEDDDDE